MIEMPPGIGIGLLLRALWGEWPAALGLIIVAVAFYEGHFFAFVLAYPIEGAARFPIGHCFAAEHVFFCLLWICESIPDF